MKKRICLRCKKEFVPTARGQKYCGKQKVKGTCSYLHNQDLMKNYRKNETFRNRQKELGQKWWNNFKKTKRYEEYLEKRRVQYLKFRFKILERDNFTCQYCGRKAPEVELQIDHKFPKSKGGKWREDNLITICKECNLGKGDIILNPKIKNG